MSDIFISYASADRARVKPLVDELQRRGWSVFWDPVIPPGKTWDQVIEAELSKARCVIVLWSRDSVQSHWVLTEAEEARQRGVLVPARLDEVVIPLAFRRIQAANLIDWSGFDGLIRAVSEIVPAEVVTKTSPVIVAAPGQTRINPKDGLTYVFIPPGSFTMGCSPGDTECEDDENPPRVEQITNAFWMGQTPVTQAAWQRVIGKNPSHFRGDNLPVENVSWIDANDYCKAVGMRIPTEKEWEYAARGGTTGARYAPLDEVAWYKKNSGGKTHPVGLKQANAFGLCDMLGNVWEWTDTDYDPKTKVVRGGSWYGDARIVRVSYRSRGGPADRNVDVGLRCVGELS